MPSDCIPHDLESYVEAEIIPRYRAFDAAHNTDHVRSVIRESLALAQGLPEADVRMVYTVAAYHDTGLCRDRKTHHLVSGEILAADPVLPRWFSPAEIEVMRQAVEDHRASADHEPRSLYGRIVAEADRLIDPDTTLRRTVQYGLRQAPEADARWHYTHFCRHLDEKYAPGGYLKLWFPHGQNARRLKELQALMADKAWLEATFARLYAEEKSKQNASLADKKSQ